MKKLVTILGVALLSVALLAGNRNQLFPANIFVTYGSDIPQGQFPQENHPPLGWETNYIPSGQPAPYYDYQEFTTGVLGTNQLFWQRAYFFLPAQTFNLMQLDTNNWWIPTGQRVTGPLGYYDISMQDGQGIVQRLVAQ